MIALLIGLSLIFIPLIGYGLYKFGILCKEVFDQLYENYRDRDWQTFLLGIYYILLVIGVISTVIGLGFVIHDVSERQPVPTVTPQSIYEDRQ